MDIAFNPSYGDEERRHRLYDGEIIILAPCPASLELVEHARHMIETAFAPHSPQAAHRELAVTDTIRILGELKPRFIHDPDTQQILRKTLIAYGCDPERTYQDVPRLRVAYPADYLSSGIAYAHHPHRDTWYAAPPCQLNWWMPFYDFEANQGMAFHPRYWDRPIKNSSHQFNYYQWNAVGRKNAAQHVGKDTRVQPHAEELVELEPAIRLVVPIGGIVLFSGAQLHSTVRNETGLARWSTDFRTVNIDDAAIRRGARTHDGASHGTSLRDFRRMTDFAAMPEEIAALYDDASAVGGVTVYKPEAPMETAHSAPESPASQRKAEMTDLRARPA